MLGMLQRVIIHHRSESYQSGSVFTLNGLVSEKKKGELAFPIISGLFIILFCRTTTVTLAINRFDLIEITFKSSVLSNRLKAFFEVS